MNYEDFSPAAQKTINQIRQVFENIRDRKIANCKMRYFRYSKNSTTWVAGHGLYFERAKYYIPYRDFIFGIVALNNVLAEEEKICLFLEEKNYFFPMINSNQPTTELTKQYPFIFISE